MDNREARIKKVVQAETEKILFLLDKELSSNHFQILNSNKSVISDLLTKISKMQDSNLIGKIDIVLFLLSRVNIDNQIFTYPVLLYDEEMGIEQYNEIFSIDVYFIYKYLDIVKQNVYKECKRYIQGNIIIPEIEQELYQHVKYFNMYLVNLLRMIFEDKEIEIQIKKLKKADMFAILQGELEEKPYCIYEYKNEKSV